MRARGWEQSTDSPYTWAQALKPLLPCFTCSNFFPAMGLNFLICKMRIIVVITTALSPFGCYSTWCWGHAWCSMDGSCGYYYLGHPSWFCLVSATSQKLPRLLILQCFLSVNFCKVYCFNLFCNSYQEWPWVAQFGASLCLLCLIDGKAHCGVDLNLRLICIHSFIHSISQSTFECLLCGIGNTAGQIKLPALLELTF